MKYLLFVLSLLIPFTVSTPLHALHSDASPGLDQTITKRQDDPNWIYYCQNVTPNTNMPPRTEAYAIADYLTSLGEQSCGMERPQGSSDPVYQNLLATDKVEVNIYFTNKAENKWVFKVDYYCNYLGTYLRNLVRVCSGGDKNEKVQGYTEIPNCPNKNVWWIVSQPMAEGGAAIEVMPRGTRHGKKMSIEGTEVWDA